jgi:hypothetical protein
MRRLALVLLVACSHPAPPPAHPEIAVADAAALKGHWLFTSEVDWTYFLAIEPDGQLHITVDRGKMGRCEQQGKLVPAGAQHFTITYDKDSCNHEAVRPQLQLAVASFTGDDLVIELGGERRHYKRGQ